jgi:hypothetical protein
VSWSNLDAELAADCCSWPDAWVGRGVQGFKVVWKRSVAAR